MSIELDISEGIAWVTIDRPERRNAVDAKTHEELSALWPRLEADDDVGVIVLTGRGELAFCTGADIDTFLPYLAARIAAGDDPRDFCGLTLRQLDKPVIAAINGAALGGGLELALATDLRIASDNAIFGLPEVKIGAIAGAGGVTRLGRVVPAAVARDMILTGRPIDAKRAYEVGLVSRIVPLSELEGAVREAARAILDNSADAIFQSRAVMRDADGIELAAALDIERSAFRKVTASPDFEAGTEAFRSGKKADFGNRWRKA